MEELLVTLVNFSELAGHIARAIRGEPTLFSLLVEEKNETDKNQRFAHDFKTLADVLIQEALKHHLMHKFPCLVDHVHGEESAEFTNTLGETITVKIYEKQEDTAILLEKVLDGNKEASDLLSSLIHSNKEAHFPSEFPSMNLNLPINQIGIWIDPIDATGEYVKGGKGVKNGILFESGLPCVTVLIGLYHLSTGLPLGGVVNQPFSVYIEENDSWQGKMYWGINYNNVFEHNIPLWPIDKKRPLLVMSSTEDPKLQVQLKNVFDIVYVTGAGYKLLLVATGVADAYFCSKSSTYRWDSGAPHGLLCAIGGGVVLYKSLLRHSSKAVDLSDKLLELQLTYNKPNVGCVQASKQWSNEQGFIAYRNSSIVCKIMECLQDISQI